MKRFALMQFVLVLSLGMPLPASARGGGTIVIVTPGRRAMSWTIVKDFPYATWDATSSTAPGTEIDAQVIDSAPLVPHELFATDRDLVNSVRTWLPKGGLLVKMQGNTRDWFCTWRFDQRSDFTQQQADKPGRVPYIEYSLCLQAGADGRTTKARIMIARPFDLMTIGQDDSGATRYRNDIQDYNSVTLTKVDSDLYPKMTKMVIYSDWRDKKHTAVCLENIIETMYGGIEFRSPGPCFTDIGQRVAYDGGVYSLVSLGEGKQYKIRVDKPINLRGLAPAGAK